MNRTINLQDHLSQLVIEGRALAYQLESHFSGKIVHKLRVCVRRLRTTMDLVGEELPAPEKEQLKKVWKQLGKVRDLDVSRGLAEKYSLSESHIKDKRSAARKKLRTQLSDKKMQHLFDEMEKISLRRSTEKVDPLPLLRDLRMKLIRTPTGPEHLHELRIVLKKIRYFREALGFDVEAFKEFQDTLGEFHDLEVFMEKHPHNLSLRRETRIKSDKAIAMARPAVQLGMKSLAEIEHQFEREMAVRAG